MSDEASKSILGQNYFELVEFTLQRHLSDGSVEDGIYGVSVDKVREVIKIPKINKLSTKLKGVEGVFELRGVPIPAINLGILLGDAYAPVKDSDQIVIAEFNMKRAGFIVNSTQRIKRIPMNEIMPPASNAGSCIGGMTLLDKDEFLFILDIEKVLEKIETASGEMIQSQGQQETHSVIEFYSNHSMFFKKTGKPLIMLGELFVDSDKANLAYDQCIKSFGYDLVKVNDLQNVKDLLSKHGDKEQTPIELVVFDQSFIETNGVEVLDWMKSQDISQNIPIILLLEKIEEKEKYHSSEVISEVVERGEFLDLGNIMRNLLHKSHNQKTA